jgi:serine/threonine protein kinase
VSLPDTLNPELPSMAAGQLVGSGRYTLIRMLALGGSCLIWLARDERLGNIVALKFLQPHFTDDLNMRLELRKEAVQNRSLSHQNIVHLYDLFESPNEAPFLVMEYVEGASLHTMRLESQNQAFSWEKLRPIVLQLCSALDHAHGMQIIHRDLKPANIMVDTQGRVRLADLGISASLNDAYTDLLGLRDNRGTMTFMSPQQLEGKLPSVSDDIYALGATVYELLCGVPPFHSGDIQHQLQEVTPQPIEARLKEKNMPCDIPVEVSQMIMNCLHKDPAIRPASIRAVAHVIAPQSASEPLFITPPPTNVTRTAGLGTASIPRARFSKEFYVVILILCALLVIAAITLWTVLKQ